MRLRALVWVGVLTIAVGVPPLMTSDAYAQPAALPAGGLVEILPPGDVVADGSTSYKVFVLALDALGNPQSGVKLKPTVNIGRIDGWEERSPGLYAYSWTPTAITAPGNAVLEVRGRTDAGSVATKIQIPIRPPLSTGVTITSSPPEIILGQDAEASISIHVAGLAGNIAPEDIGLRASAGEIQNVIYLGQGKFSARYVALRVNFPQLAIIGVIDLRNPEHAFGTVAIPLKGKVTYPVPSTPNANVVLRIGDRDYGPAVAGPTGRAEVPIIVPPGVGMASKIEVLQGRTSEEPLDLRVPETLRVSMLPTAYAVPADGRSRATLRVAIFTPDGRPDPSGRVTFSAAGGIVSNVRSIGVGLFAADFVPSFSNTATTAKVTATLTSSSVQSDTMEIPLAPARPRSITLRANPEILTADATALRVFAKIAGPAGQGLDRRDLRLAVTGATAVSAPEDLRNGDYRVDFNAAGNAHVDVVASVGVPPTGNPLAHVLLFPQRGQVANDGVSLVRLTVVSVDEFGYPVPGAAVQLKLDAGDGSIEQRVTTDEGGVAQVVYTAGRAVGLIRVRASSGHRTGVAQFIQAPEGLSAPIVLAGGTEGELALLESWRDVTRLLRVRRDGSKDTSAPEMEVVVAKVGALARVQMLAEPAVAAPGGKVTVRLSALDTQGLGIAELPFDILASPGDPSVVTDLGGGQYRATVALPKNASGELKVAVASGEVSSFLRVPISGTAAVHEPEPVAASSASLTDESARQRADSEDVPSLRRIRVRGSFVAGSYAYQQRPLTESGPLLPATVTVGRRGGGSAATPIGAEIAGRGFFHDYVGFDASFRATQWSMTAPEFANELVPDTLFHFNVDAIGRYPFQAGNNHFWVGGRLGYHGSDVLYFTGDFDRNEIGYQSLLLQGLGFGAEVGTEIGDLYLHGVIGGRLVGVTRWFATAIDVHAGYQLTDHLFIDAGFGYVDRQVTLIGETSRVDQGHVSDRQLIGRIGGGWRF
jgi:hypothetical protein